MAQPGNIWFVKQLHITLCAFAPGLSSGDLGCFPLVMEACPHCLLLRSLGVEFGDVSNETVIGYPGGSTSATTVARNT